MSAAFLLLRLLVEMGRYFGGYTLEPSVINNCCNFDALLYLVVPNGMNYAYAILRWSQATSKDVF